MAILSAGDYLAKSFQGSILILIILLLICLPAGLIYLLIKWEESPQYPPYQYQQPYQAPSYQAPSYSGPTYCAGCGAQLEAGAQFCAKCGRKVE